jgi:hypothetical protein
LGANQESDTSLSRQFAQLQGTGALITFTVDGKAGGGDDIALPILQEACNLAAATKPT